MDAATICAALELGNDTEIIGSLPPYHTAISCRSTEITELISVPLALSFCQILVCHNARVGCGIQDNECLRPQLPDTFSGVRSLRLHDAKGNGKNHNNKHNRPYEIGHSVPGLNVAVDLEGQKT